MNFSLRFKSSVITPRTYSREHDCDRTSFAQEGSKDGNQASSPEGESATPWVGYESHIDLVCLNQPAKRRPVATFQILANTCQPPPPRRTRLISPWKAVAKAARALGSLLLSHGDDVDGDRVELQRGSGLIAHLPILLQELTPRFFSRSLVSASISSCPLSVLTVKSSAETSGTY
jgi:hypothetical protein